MTTEEEFQLILSRLDNLAEPTTTEELNAYMAALSEAIEKCERLVLYLATSPSRSEDMVTYLFQYKQLLTLERSMSELKYTFSPIGAPTSTPVKKAWWRFGA